MGSLGVSATDHDRCGRRLKLFVYVEAVTADSHPTQVAAETHNLLYYRQG
jgi:hypothetical protein